MAKINVYFGTMGSGKSFDLIRTAYNYKERGMVALVYKPETDTRDGSDECFISTRVGMKYPAKWIRDNDNMITVLENDYVAANSMLAPVKVVIIDECQFLSEKKINEMQYFSMKYDIPIIFYGLKVDFTGHLFEGSKRILEVADNVSELKGICHCGQIARQNARVINGVIQKTGETVSIGGNEMYVALCNKCFREGDLK